MAAAEVGAKAAASAEEALSEVAVATGSVEKMSEEASAAAAEAVAAAAAAVAKAKEAEATANSTVPSLNPRPSNISNINAVLQARL